MKKIESKELVNTLYYGDNLEILRKHIRDESVDLIYLDPPFNSQRAYNVIFQDKSGQAPSSQIQAFEDTWYWTQEAQAAFDEIMTGQYSLELKEMMQAFRDFMGTNNLMAYLTMMAIRLVELRRVLKGTGSIYLHCDPTASHYLKILMDYVFGIQNFRNEIVWKRTSAHSDPKRFGANSDRLLFYTKTDRWKWNPIFREHNPEYLKRFRHKDPDGRLWTDDNLSAKGLSGGGYEYQYKGIKSLWRVPKDKMKELDAEGRLHFTSAGGIRLKRYLENNKGLTIQSLWEDIPPINSQSKERLGYPTQKPVALLERVLQASSDEGDVVLDPFCGCGTAIAAAEKLGRKWMGIDITHLAISLIKKRLIDHFPDAKFKVEGEPKSVEDAEVLFKQSPFQFESWAVSLIGGQPYKSSGGGDTGIDGFLYFKDFKGKFHRIIIEVKGGNYQPKDIRALTAVLEREGAPLGVLITLNPPTRGMISEAAALGKWTIPENGKSYPVLQIFTIQDFFDGKRPELPDTSETLKKAKREIRESEKNPPRLL